MNETELGDSGKNNEMEDPAVREQMLKFRKMGLKRANDK